MYKKILPVIAGFGLTCAAVYPNDLDVARSKVAPSQGYYLLDPNSIVVSAVGNAYSRSKLIRSGYIAKDIACNTIQIHQLMETIGRELLRKSRATDNGLGTVLNDIESRMENN